jgi:small subunit ribosomal protein S16
MKKMGRTHRPFFRICATDRRAPRDGRVLEELGTYDPSVPDTDARAILKAERIDYWLSVGAQPSEKVAALIKKYGTGGTHTEAQKASIERLAQPKPVPDAGVPASKPKSRRPADEEAAADSESSDQDTPVQPVAEENSAATPQKEAATS